MSAPPRLLLRTVALLLAALVAAVLAVVLRPVTGSLATWWPAAGLFIGALVLSPRRWWPGILVAIAAISMGAHLAGGRPPVLGVGLMLGNVAEAFVAATLLRGRGARRRVALADTRDYLRLLLAAIGGALTMGVVAAASAAALGEAAWPIARTVTPAHLAATLVVLPLLLLDGSAPLGPRRLVERVAQPAALVASLTAALVLSDTLAPVLLPLPFLVWAALRLSPRAAAAQMAVVAVCATSSTAFGIGPIATLTDYVVGQSGQSTAAGAMLAGANVQAFVVCVALLTVPISLASAARAHLVRGMEAERELTSTMLSTTSAMIFVTTPDGVVTQVNDSLARLTGFKPSDVLGRRFWELEVIPQERAEAVRTIFADGDGRAVPLIREADIMTACGNRLRVVWSNNVVRDPQGQVRHVVCTATDVTSERTSHELVQHLFGSPKAAPMLSLDPEYAVTLCNRAGADLLGLDAELVVGRPFVDLMCPDERAQFLEGLRDAASRSRESRQAAPLPHEWTWHRPDGETVHLSAAVSTVLDAVGKHVGYLLVASDVTEKRASQDALVRALETERQAVQRLRSLDAAKNDFVSTVSHELRTPTTSIVGYTEMLRDGEAGEVTEEQDGLLAAIARNGDRLIAVANDLLTLAGLESQDRSTWVEERVALDRVVMQASEAIAPQLERRLLDVIVEVPDDEIAVVGDATHLDRVVVNLLSNAVKFTPDHGRVRCRLWLEEDTAVIEVSDTGIGIPEDEQEELFSKFFRSSTAQAQAIQGTGLGLSIIHRIVEEHGGRIDVRSAHQRGSTFTVSLPVAPLLPLQLVSAG